MPRTLVADSTGPKQEIKETLQKVREVSTEASHDNTMSKEYQDFMQFLQGEVENLRKYSRLSEDPGFMELNSALAHHEGVMLGLLATKNILLKEKQDAELNYKRVWAELSDKVRKEQNTAEKSSTKYLSQSSLDNLTLTEYWDTLEPLIRKKDLLEAKYHTISNLVDSWERFSFNINVISKNNQIEAMVSKHSKSELLEDEDGKPIVF